MKKIIALTLAICLTAALTISPASAKDFTDTKGHWAQEAIDEITDLGFFLGSSDTTFSPDNIMTRAMFVTVLSRVAVWLDLPVEYGNAAALADVSPDAYYADAVAWASEKGIVQGNENGLFHPNAAITRQQMCTILVRFLSEYAGIDLSGYDADISVFLDADDISSYAVQSVAVCYAAGLIVGTPVEGGVKFQPAASSNRATVATILWRFVQQVVDWNKADIEEPDAANVNMGGAGTGSSEIDGDKHTQEENQVAGYLETMLKNYNSSKYLLTTDQEVQDCMAILMDCIEDALDQRSDGQVLSKAFIRSEYGSEISELKGTYSNLTNDQLDQLNNVIVRLESTEHIYVVMDYFGVNI